MTRLNRRWPPGSGAQRSHRSRMKLRRPPAIAAPTSNRFIFIESSFAQPQKDSATFGSSSQSPIWNMLPGFGPPHTQLSSPNEPLQVTDKCRQTIEHVSVPPSLPTDIWQGDGSTGCDGSAVRSMQTNKLSAACTHLGSKPRSPALSHASSAPLKHDKRSR